ncbi:MAG TPA: nucleoside deaminase [Flavobacteriales bacterium]|nr:nucleoside deaminase [Flavobacteriales bacterium]HIO68491.1 nucleoside deaminase [Flavobacteriales bacterium]
MDENLKLAYAEAVRGRNSGGIPIGSVLVKEGKVIGRGHNQRVQTKDPMAHAEIDCLRNAGRIGSYEDTVLYSTLMPCYLCAGAVVQFGIKKVIVGESRTFSGAKQFMVDHGVEVIDLDDPACIDLMQKFIAEEPELWNEDIGK